MGMGGPATKEGKGRKNRTDAGLSDCRAVLISAPKLSERTFLRIYEGVDWLPANQRRQAAKQALRQEG